MGLFGKKKVTTKEIMVDGILDILSNAASAPQWAQAGNYLVSEKISSEQVGQELINLQFFVADWVINSNYSGDVRDQMRDFLLIALEKSSPKAFEQSFSRQIAYGDAYVNNPLEHMPGSYSLAKRFCQFCDSDGDPSVLMILSVCITEFMKQLSEFVSELNE